MIEIQDLTKIFRTGLRKGDVIALDNISLSINMGEILGLLGPNGAGKTTLFKVLLGVTRATSGMVAINGRPPSDPGSRLTVGYLPENHRFPSHLTGIGLLKLTGRLSRMSGSDITSRSDELLDLVSMDRWADTKIRNYSKGMLQRIGLAQALMNDPEILLLDEPTDGVDPVGRVEIREALTKIRNAGRLIVLNSHLLSEVESVADRVAILQKGRLLRVASVEQLTNRLSQYEIKAEMGSHVIELPEEVGKIVAVTAQGILVELTRPEYINEVIDRLRMKRIPISIVRPMTVSLEQSFIETVSAAAEEDKP
ncbi:MAG: ABC transporter ATP-binding protein [bacterium]